jgi:two-component system LytT family sensor kinase
MNIIVGAIFHMNEISPSIKKQFKVAIYTSPVISALMTTPIYILDKRHFGPYSGSLLFSTLIVFLLWSVNIFLSYWISKQGRGRWTGAGRYILSYLISILFTAGVSHRLFYPSGNTGFGSYGIFVHFHLIVFLAMNTVILVLQDLLITRERKDAIALENTRLRMKNMEAINQQLKQQIHPHFLFNSLSTLKSLMATSPGDAEDYLIRLSDFLRASISSHLSDTVQLGGELKLCIDYLEMQKLRFGQALEFTVDIPEAIKASCSLPAFSLQLLAENAIKHNILTKEAPLYINIAYSEGMIRVVNNRQNKESAEVSEGTGLSNLGERYRLLSGDEIRIETSPDKFSVSIKVLQYEGGHH